MNITLDNIGKRYGYNWVIRSHNTQFEHGKIYGISGPNGSGKSTLMKIISGFLTPTSGEVRYVHNASNIHRSDISTWLSYAAPYVELIEELTLAEHIRLHFKFKTLRSGLEWESLPQKMGLSGAQHKLISDFSSGMKQRLKLGLSFFSDTPLLLLDEPTTNLDRRAKDWFYRQIDEHKNSSLIIIASNEEEELAKVDEVYPLD